MKSALFLALVAFIGASAVSAGSLSEDQYQFLFTKWVQQHGNQYETTNELFTKYSTFKSNVDLVIAHNAKSDETYKMAINKFADLSHDEFSKNMGLKTTKIPKSTKAAVQKKAVAPCPMANSTKYIDWVEKGVLGAVKDQRQCGSCWAFSATAPIEAAWKIKGNPAVVLAEQQFVDCVTEQYDSSFISEGCNGGLMSEAMTYATREGQCLEKDYPYTGRDGTCRQCTAAVKPSNVREIHGIDQYKEEIANGPFSVGIAASSSSFQFYSSGVVSNCKDRSLNHGVVVTGIFIKDDQEAMAVRNSWGSNWGDRGYIYLSTTGNQCALGLSAWDVAVDY